MVAAKVKEKAFLVVKFVLGWPISLVALFFLGKTFLAQSTSVVEHIRSIHLPLLVPGILCFLMYYFLRSFLWYKLITFAGHVFDARESLFVWSFTQLRRYIPGNIWAALGVAAQYSKKDISKKEVGTYILWESEMVIIAGVFLSVLSIPFISKYYLDLGNYELLFAIALLLLAAGGTLIYCFNRRLTSRFSGKVKTLLDHFFPSYTPFDSFKSLLYFFLSFVFLGLGYFFVIASLTYLDPNIIWQFVGFFTLSLLVGFASVITPSGLGVREGVLTIFLGNLMPIALAAFVSIFCRLVLIASEILFIGIAFLIHKVRKGKFDQYFQYVTSHIHEAILVLSYLVFSWYFIAISFLRFDNFYTGRFDLGNMSQTVWNTLNGRIFEFSNPNSTETISRMAFHADVILVAFAPLYLIWESPKTLLFMQVLIVGAGAFFVYSISLHFLKSKLLALIISLLFLINPSLQRSIIYDFHAVTLATTFILGAMHFVFKKKYVPFILFALLAGICKEQVWAVTGLMGLYIALIQKKWQLGLLTFFASLFIAVALIWYVIPQASGGSQHFALDYYSSSSEDTSSPTELLKSFVSSPGNTVELLSQKGRVEYLSKLLLPLGYLPLLSPIFLIFTLPDMTINILSKKPELYQIYYQYTAVITPFLFIALITGLAWFFKKFSKMPKLFAICYLLFFGLFGAYRYGPLPGAKEPNTDMLSKPYPNRESLDALIRSIPEHASVSTTNSIGSHLSHRRLLYNVPLAMDTADYVIIDNSDDNLPNPQGDYATKSADLRSSSEYALFYKDAHVSAYRRNLFEL